MAAVSSHRKRGSRRPRRSRLRGARGRSGRRLAGHPSSDRGNEKRARLGAKEGHQQGFKAGYEQGAQSGIRQFGTLFEGTSIIIPTYNQLRLLKPCIESIERHTDLPHEIIVVDNGSTDGTRDYLQELGGQVRFRALDANRGFSAAVNVGLMMAKGRTIVLLNNDVLVTDKWLNNLLRCLNSDEQIGMVGPITNYISGDQMIKVTYRKLEDMPAFARKMNRPNPSLWEQTDQLRGFCLLFRRELFEQAGYFDEGFEIGNFEDDDYNVRVRMLGKNLVIAGDTFIHHFGSMSVKALGERFHGVSDRNESFFLAKWNNPNEWIHHARSHPATGNMALYYPERIVVQGMGSPVYWIENGRRHPVRGTLSFPVVRVSQIDLRLWPLGDPVEYEVAEREFRGLSAEAGQVDGVLLLPDGAAYHIEGSKVRRIVSSSAMSAWNLHLKPAASVTPEVLSEWEPGLPIIAPPLIKQSL